MKNKINKRSSHPVMFFIYMSLFVIVVSAIADLLNLQVTYDKLTTIAGEVETTTAAVNSLFSIDGLKFLITSSFDNLTSFIPFGSLLIASIAFGVALKSGYLKTLCMKISKKIPKFIIVFIFSLICILASIDNNMGYVIFLPLGAILFMSLNRNPIGGLALAFASIASGHGAGFFITALDYNLSSITEAGAKLIDVDYVVSHSSNLIFIVVAAIFIAGICTFITEKFVVRRLGRNQIEEDDELIISEDDEKRGLLASTIATVIVLIPLIVMLIPVKDSMIFGLLLDKSQDVYSKMIFSSESLIMSNLVGIISFLLIVQGFIFGIASGTIKKIRDMVNFSTEYLKNIGSIFVLVFFAAQFVAIMEESNLGVVITSALANIIGASEFSFIPLVLILFVVAMVSNIVLPSSVAKWSILAPNIMPVIMKANITPEFAQLVFRAGESATRTITPLFCYFVIFIGFIEVFTKNKNDFSIRGCFNVIIPYFFAVTLIWLFLLVSWFVIGLPIGPGIYPSF